MTGRSARQDFPRDCRLLTGGDFSRVFRARRTVADRYFRIHHADSDRPRLGLAVSKRVDKRAVNRNRIRRIAREVFRVHRVDLPDRDLVVVARSAAAAGDNAALARSLITLYRKID